MTDMCEERSYIINAIKQGKSNEEIKVGRITDDWINHYRNTISI